MRDMNSERELPSNVCDDENQPDISIKCPNISARRNKESKKKKKTTGAI